MRIHICHVISTLNMGGTQTKILGLVQRLSPERYSHSLVNLGPETVMSDRLRDVGVEVTSLNLKPNFSLAIAYPKLVSAVRKTRPDIIQGWVYPGNIAASLAQLANPRAKTVWHIANMASVVKFEPLRSRLALTGNRILSGLPHAIVYVGNASANEHLAMGFPRRNMRVIVNGFDVELFHPDPHAGSALREALGVGKDEVVFGHVARFQKVKNQVGFIETIAQLGHRGLPVRGIMVGKGVDLDNPVISKAVQDSGAEPFLLFLGERPDAANLMQAFDVAVNTSFSEGLPRSVAEAMATGVPVVATDVGETKAVVGDTGFIVPPHDPTALVDALAHMVTLSAGERARLGALARRRIETNYSLDAAAKNHDELYRSLVEQP